jgi:hypothetical protein
MTTEETENVVNPDAAEYLETVLGVREPFNIDIFSVNIVDRIFFKKPVRGQFAFVADCFMFKYFPDRVIIEVLEI